MPGRTLMDVPKVKDMSSKFADAAQTMDAVHKALQVAIAALKATAFISLGSTKAMEVYLQNIDTKLQAVIKDCQHVSTELNNAVKIITGEDTQLKSDWA